KDFAPGRAAKRGLESDKAMELSRFDLRSCPSDRTAVFW
ncbi:unnamed protein product, partial [Mycena citricolor]